MLRLYGAAQIDGEPVRVKLTVRRYGDADRLWSLESAEVERPARLAGPGTSGQSSETRAASRSGAIDVADLLAGVKRDTGGRLLDDEPPGARTKRVEGPKLEATLKAAARRQTSSAPRARRTLVGRSATRSPSWQ